MMESSVSVSLEEEMTLHLPGFLLGRCDDAIVENVEGISNGLKIVYGCWSPPLKAKKLYESFVCVQRKNKTRRNFLGIWRKLRRIMAAKYDYEEETRIFIGNVLSSSASFLTFGRDESGDPERIKFTNQIRQFRKI